MTPAFELTEYLQFHPNYRALPSMCSQQIIKFLVKNWKSYFKALKSYKKDPSKFNEMPKPPGYKKHYQLHLLYFTDQQIKLRDGYVVFPKRVGLRVKTRLNVKINQARIIPKGSGFLLELVYERETKPLRPVKNILAVDFGVNNLMAGVSNVAIPLIIKGTPLKSYNQWINKNKARIISIYHMQQPGKKYIRYGDTLIQIMDKRYRKVEDFLHQASSLLIRDCIQQDIDTIVIGYNEGWKHKISIGKVNNQNFVGIPFYNLLGKILYKAEDNGIRVIIIEEAYTSKCSFLDDEPICKHSKYMGKRVHRGLFRSSKGILINADCNGAGNIGRKEFPVLFNYGIVDVVNHPLVLVP